jgi:Gpi18-like mannosyltransferase
MLSAWANFDGVYYLLIAAKGYTVNAGFFPLFPLSIHMLTSIFGTNMQGLPFEPIQYFTALILASFYFLLSLIVLYKLVRLDYKDNIAIFTIVFTLIFPTSFFYVSIYSESLFLLLSVSSFYFARTNRWFLASLCGGLLTATRLVEIAIIPALVIEFVKQKENMLKPKGLLLLLMPLGILGYMLFNFLKWGDAFYFIQAQGAFHNERSVDYIVFIPQTIFRYIKILTTLPPGIFEWWIALLEISTFIFVSIMFFVAWKKKIRISYILFALICFLIPASTGTFTGLPRYALVLFPIFITLALVKNKFVKIAYSILGFSLLLILFALFSKGYFVA